MTAQPASDTRFQITPYVTTVDQPGMMSSRAVLRTSCSRWSISRGTCSSMVYVRLHPLFPPFFCPVVHCKIYTLSIVLHVPNDIIQISMDWVGIILERLTGQSLGQYMEENIFRPLGLTNISIIPSKEMKAKLAYMHQRTPDGRITMRDHLLRRALMLTQTETDDKSLFHSGGAGCFSTASDYARMLLPIPLFPLKTSMRTLPSYLPCLSLQKGRRRIR